MKLKSLWAGLAAAIACVAAHSEPVKITNIGHGYYAAALYVAKQEKIFEKHGLEPDITYVQGGALALQTVLTKQADVGILSYEHVLTAAVQGQRIVSFFNISNRPLNNIIASAKLAAGAEKLSLEDKIKRLKGPVIASGGMGSIEHMHEVVASGADAVAMADVLHYKRIGLAELRSSALAAGLQVRRT